MVPVFMRASPVDLVEASREALPERHNFIACHAMSADPRWPVNHRALGSGYLA